MASIRTNNNPAMLIWAREEIGYNVEQAAKAIGISTESLISAEAGEHSLTLNQLRKAADVYGFSFGYFYLKQPPRRKTYKPVPDFRIQPGLYGTDHYRLHLEIKKARDRRDTFLELAHSLELETVSFTPLASPEPKNTGSVIRKRLGVSTNEIRPLRLEDVYSYWKQKIEGDGVLVYESQYIPRESGVLGAALYYEEYPIILIKRGGNSNPRKLFTLLHEYAHLLKGKSAINDAAAQSVNSTSTYENQLETACNHLAAEILAPSELIHIEKYRDLSPVDMMEQLAADFKITFMTAAMCLKRMNLIDDKKLSHLLDLRRRIYEAKSNDKQKEVKIPRETVSRLDMGRLTFNTVLSAYGAGVIDIFDASRILNLRVNKIDKLISGIS